MMVNHVLKNLFDGLRTLVNLFGIIIKKHCFPKMVLQTTVTGHPPKPPKIYSATSRRSTVHRNRHFAPRKSGLNKVLGDDGGS